MVSVAVPSKVNNLYFTHARVMVTSRLVSTQRKKHINKHLTDTLHSTRVFKVFVNDYFVDIYVLISTKQSILCDTASNLLEHFG